MNIRIGKIDNINKKLVAGTLVFTLAFSSALGHVVSNVVESNRAKYENFQGIASFNRMKKCYFIGVKNNQGNIKYYIAEKIDIKGSNNNSCFYVDLLSGENVFAVASQGLFNIDDNSLTTVISAEQYLYETKNVKDMYSVDDINMMIDDLKKENKILVK